MDQLRGIITVLNTPFTADNAIDFDGLRENVSMAIEAGVAGMLVPAMASEVDHLDDVEKREIVHAVIAETNGRVAIIGGASSETQSQRLKLAREYVNLGCDGILVQIDPQTEYEQVERDVDELAQLGPKILMLQDWDANDGGLAIETIIRLFERVEHFNWLKIEVSDAGPKYSRVLEATNGRLNVAGGWAVSQMIDGLERGVHAFMPTAMHNIYVQIYQMHVNGDRDGAAQLFQRIKPVLAFSNQSLEVSIRFFKRMLFVQGVYATANVRIAGESFNTEQEQTADRLIDFVTELQSEL